MQYMCLIPLTRTLRNSKVSQRVNKHSLFMTWLQQSASRLFLNRVNRVHIHTPYILSLTLKLFFHPYVVLSRRPILLDSPNKMLYKKVKKSGLFKQRPYGNLGVRGTAESVLELISVQTKMCVLQRTQGQIKYRKLHKTINCTVIWTLQHIGLFLLELQNFFPHMYKL
jgi:hypothetical protein